MGANTEVTAAHAGLILLIEDNADDAVLTQRALQRARLLNPVRHVSDAATALTLLQNQAYSAQADGQRIDLILLDLGLPGMGGRQFLDAIAEDRHLRRIPVIVLTSSDSVTDRLSSYKQGALGFLQKPIDVTELFRVLSDRSEAGLVFVRVE